MDDRDAFAGGFVAGIVEGKSLDEAIDMGHWLASLSIRELGPQYVILDESNPPSRRDLWSSVASANAYRSSSDTHSPSIPINPPKPRQILPHRLGMA